MIPDDATAVVGDHLDRSVVDLPEVTDRRRFKPPQTVTVIDIINESHAPQLGRLTDRRPQGDVDRHLRKLIVGIPATRIDER